MELKKVGPSEAEPFWTDFLRSLKRRGLRGVKLVISDSHEGIEAAASKVLKATWQRCRVHFMRNALAHAGKTQRRMVSASIVRLVGAMMLEQNDEWSLNRRYMQLEGLQTVSDTVPTRLSAVAR